MNRSESRHTTLNKYRVQWRRFRRQAWIIYRKAINSELDEKYNWQPPFSDVPERKVEKVGGGSMLRYSEFFDISDRFSSHPAAFIRYTTRPVYPEYGFKSAARLSDSFQCIEIHPAYLDLIQGVEALRFNNRDSVNMYFRFADGSVIEIAVLQEMDLWTDGQRILGSIK